MYSTRKMIWYAVMFLIGLSLVVLAALGYVENFFSGFGSGFCAVSIVRIALGIKYRKDEDYAKRKDLAENDERNIFLSNKAKSFAYYLTVLALAVATVVLFMCGYHNYGTLCSAVMCLMLVLYYIAFLVLKKRY